MDETTNIYPLIYEQTLNEEKGTKIMNFYAKKIILYLKFPEKHTILGVNNCSSLFNSNIIL